MPTIADFIDVPHDEEWSGDSLLPLLSRNAGEDRIDFIEYHAHGARNGMFTIRKGDFKYV